MADTRGQVNTEQKPDFWCGLPKDVSYDKMIVFRIYIFEI